MPRKGFYGHVAFLVIYPFVAYTLLSGEFSAWSTVRTSQWAA